MRKNSKRFHGERELRKGEISSPAKGEELKGWGGFTVYCPGLDIYTQGDDMEDEIKNRKEAAELQIDKVCIENMNPKGVQRKRVELVICDADALRYS